MTKWENTVVTQVTLCNNTGARTQLRNNGTRQRVVRHPACTHASTFIVHLTAIRERMKYTLEKVAVYRAHTNKRMARLRRRMVQRDPHGGITDAREPKGFFVSSASILWANPCQLPRFLLLPDGYRGDLIFCPALLWNTPICPSLLWPLLFALLYFG